MQVSFKGYDFPDMLIKIISLDVDDILITELVRLKCQNCGAWKRKRDCPPFTPSLGKCREVLERYKHFSMFVWRSDGSIAWRDGFPKEKLVKKRERGLKGTAIGMQVAIQNIMLDMRHQLVHKYKVRIWTAGPCHKCRVCTLKEEGKCAKKMNVPAMESWGMDVFGMFDNAGIEYQHPVVDFITCASLIALKRR